MNTATRLLALATALVTGATACTAASAPARRTAAHETAAAPTAGDQLDWVVSASRHLPISDADARAHVAASSLAAMGGAAGLTKALAQNGPLTAQEPAKSSKTQAVGWFTGARRTSLLVTVATDASGMIIGLYLAKQPGTWKDLDAELHRLAPRASYATFEIGAGGRCRVVHGLHASTPRPLGSAFKLYVLGALSDAVARGTVSWNTTMPVKDAWKSLPSGILQDKPAGTTLTLGQYADYMISISDNTAADHLVHRLGRAAVETELTRLGNRHQRGDRPFLTTREMFALKGAGYPARADRYLALPQSRRAAALLGLDAVPLAQITPWQQPRDIDSIEWFAAPTDVCAAFDGLDDRSARPGQSGVGKALSINDGGIGLDRAAYPKVWFKGGSEPGVLTLNYLARTSRGRTIVTSVMLSDPKTAFTGTVALDALAVARAGVQLATR
ncbi:serine hydrolase [Actinomadura opuntiae]|uniref:serine hydrolase n=1 Tax=Actinomadura sp. OS1-43 TaxID=604315 RepID=UPI00255A8DEE|nr:serine hydrolase [Actinomadura sp. OS1-43]MDL4813705.1 serine hydrolase [Actinomadura sp. OS1-43]